MSALSAWCEDILKLRQVAAVTEDAELAELLLAKAHDMENQFKDSLLKVKAKAATTKAAAAPDSNVFLIKPQTPS